MDFRLNEDQLALQQMVREFTDKEVRPIAAHMDETGEFNEELWRMMADLGLFGILAPEEYGGSGMDHVAFCIAMEEIVRGSGNMYNWLVTSNGPNTGAILLYGTEAQKKKYIPKTASGEFRCAFAITEPDHGSDISGMKTTAVREGDHFVINGTKTFITMATLADRILTTCKYVVDGEDKGYVTLIVDRDCPGLVIGKDEHKMGLRGTSLNTVFYENCIVPAENVLGEPGKGMEPATACLSEVRISCGAFAVGLAQEAIDLAIAYSKERMQFGKRISQFQNTQFVLAECQTKVDAARLLTWRAAAELDQGNGDRWLGSMAKYYAGEVCNDVVRKCLQVFGGYGYCVEYPIERIFRDAKIAEIFDGTAEIHKVIISKSMGVR